MSSAEGSCKRDVASKIAYLCSMGKHTHAQEFNCISHRHVFLSLSCARNVGDDDSAWIAKTTMGVAFRAFSFRYWLSACWRFCWSKKIFCAIARAKLFLGLLASTNVLMIIHYLHRKNLVKNVCRQTNAILEKNVKVFWNSARSASKGSGLFSLK